VGGAVVGVLSALPVISAGNFCCCLWIVSGGIVAAYVLQQNDPAPISTGDAALAGLCAGMAGAVICLILSIPITLVFAPLESRFLERLSDYTGNMPPELRDTMTNYAMQGAGLVVKFFGMLFVGSGFSTLGGLLGAAMFRKKPQTTNSM
jgi:hypothetical protein